MLNKFFEMLAVCEDKVTYGPKSVAKALENNAVETLLLSDKLFRAKNIVHYGQNCARIFVTKILFSQDQIQWKSLNKNS